MARNNYLLWKVSKRIHGLVYFADVQCRFRAHGGADRASRVGNIQLHELAGDRCDPHAAPIC